MKQYRVAPIIRHHNPRRATDYHDYRACLRADFEYWCAYCLSDEGEVAPGSTIGQFEIDHFRPTKPFGHLKTIYENLYWSCYACNRRKRQTWPDAQEETKGYRFVDPCKDAAFDHLEIQGDTVVAKTFAGRYTIAEINLNSAEHKQRRRKRAAALRLWQLLRSVLATTPEGAVKTELETKCDQILAEVEGRALPWDADAFCRCDSGK